MDRSNAANMHYPPSFSRLLPRRAHRRFTKSSTHPRNTENIRFSNPLLYAPAGFPRLWPLSCYSCLAGLDHPPPEKHISCSSFRLLNTAPPPPTKQLRPTPKRASYPTSTLPSVIEPLSPAPSVTVRPFHAQPACARPVHVKPGLASHPLYPSLHGQLKLLALLEHELVVDPEKVAVQHRLQDPRQHRDRVDLVVRLRHVPVDPVGNVQRAV